MIYPNIQIISKIENIYFTDYYNKSLSRKTSAYNYLRSYFNLDQNFALVIISVQLKNTKGVINFIKNNNISKVYFFIDDVFRSSLENSFLKKSEEFEELKIIKHIINKTKIKNYKIFSCEVVNKKIFGFDIEYADLYLTNFIKRTKNYELLNKKNLDYKISCLNNRSDIHREYISVLLCKKEDVFLTMNEKMPLDNLIDINVFNINHLDNILINLFLTNSKYFNDNSSKFLDPLSATQSFLNSTIQNNDFTYQIIQNSFLNIITETCYSSNYVYISEKTIKPIICKRPFLMLGTPGSILHLKNLGFKTFNRWWDESYDLELNHAKRLQKVYYIAEEILNKSMLELEIILDEMSEVLNHNRNHLNTVSKKLLPMIHDI
jgi:hypothetical protein